MVVFLLLKRVLAFCCTPYDALGARCKQVDRIGEANLARVMATMSVLGFSTPSFSFGTDIMLPVDSNQQLRDLLLSTTEEGEAGLEDRTSRDKDLLAVRTLGKFANVFVPEVSRATAPSSLHMMST